MVRKPFRNVHQPICMVIVVIHNLRKVGSLPYGYLPTWPWVVVAEEAQTEQGLGFRV